MIVTCCNLQENLLYSVIYYSDNKLGIPRLRDHILLLVVVIIFLSDGSYIAADCSNQLQLSLDSVTCCILLSVLSERHLHTDVESVMEIIKCMWRMLVSGVECSCPCDVQ
uniref:Uncharacterized protein n=1 Tax=Oryza brachyantha TaxID=4533 RepID=J3N019_ORYBR